MNIRLIGISTPENEIGLSDEKAIKFIESQIKENSEESFTNLSSLEQMKKIQSAKIDYFAGLNAGMCYSPDGLDALSKQEIEKTIKRARDTKANGHHSVYGHTMLNFEFSNIEKALAIILNNESEYNTSERSGRYTDMEKSVTERDRTYYTKWMSILTEKIGAEYKEKYPAKFTEAYIKKMAQENARYMISIHTPTNMTYSTSYRQLNYIYRFMQNEIANPSNYYFKSVVPAMQEFLEEIDKVVVTEPNLFEDNKGRGFSLFGNRKLNKYFGDTYVTNYDGSFAHLAQAQRHRSINYNILLKDELEFYVPEIIRDDDKMVEDWLSDMSKQSEILPQGMLISINETSSPERLILKSQERLCACAQLEIMRQTKSTIEEYIKNIDPRCEEVKKMLLQNNKGMRCANGYHCAKTCNFAEGVSGKRKI